MEQKENKKTNRLRFIFIAIPVILLIIALVFSFFNWESNPNTYRETAIRRAAAAYLSKEPDDLTDEDFKSFEGFCIFGPVESGLMREISDLSMFEKFTNLKSLNISHIRYPRKAIPKGMNFLAKHGIIDINKRYALDLSPLKKLKNLEVLWLEGSQVKNIKPLSSLTKIHTLSLSGTLVTDLRPLGKLKNLRELVLMQTSVSNIKPLKGLTNLKLLYLNDSPNITKEQIEDLQKALPELKIEYKPLLKPGESLLIPYLID